MNRRERLETVFNDMSKYTTVYPIDGPHSFIVDQEAELRALWAIEDAEEAYRNGSGNVYDEIAANDVIEAARAAYKKE